MDPAAADFYEEDGKDLDFYDFERLPTLPEDEVSPHPKVGPHLTFPDGGVCGEFPGRVPPVPPPRGPGRGSRGIPQLVSPPPTGLKFSPGGDRTLA